MSEPSDPVRAKADTIAEMHRSNEARVPTHQRLIERFASAWGRPSTLYVLLVLIAAWTMVNTVFRRRWDAPPFFWLQGALGLLSLATTLVVLITQNRQLRQTERRAQLDLHINLLTEEKVAKLVALLEELRRDLPSVRDRHDPQAEAMARGTDAHVVLDELEKQLDAAATDDDEAPERSGGEPRRPPEGGH